MTSDCYIDVPVIIVIVGNSITSRDIRFRCCCLPPVRFKPVFDRIRYWAVLMKIVEYLILYYYAVLFYNMDRYYIIIHPMADLKKEYILAVST